MAENFERSRGRNKNFKLDRGGMPADFGPFYGIVKNTYDKNRTGRIEVYIEAFADQGLDESLAGLSPAQNALGRGACGTKRAHPAR